ncbi:MAG: DUF4124 domain-containing protein [Pedobacter sp.]|nr:DUF4124 domain-containing protein [Pedobacter sp.]
MSLHRILLAFTAMLVFSTAQAEVYRYIDSNGNLVLTDTPPKDKEGAAKVEKIETKPLMTVPAFQGGKGSGAAVAAPPKKAGVAYEIVIQNPEPGATFQKNVAEEIPVAVSVSPSVIAGHRLVYLLDGQEQSGAIGTLSSASFDRGAHRLEVRVLDEAGNVLAKAAVEFNIQQASAQGPTASKPK